MKKVIKDLTKEKIVHIENINPGVNTYIGVDKGNKRIFILVYVGLGKYNAVLLNSLISPVLMVKGEDQKDFTELMGDSMDEGVEWFEFEDNEEALSYVVEMMKLFKDKSCLK